MKTGDNITAQKGNWKFDKNVSKNFVNHISRSIPGYAEGHKTVCELSDFFLHENSICYEIGSSTAELTKKLYQHNKHKKNIHYTGIETESSMINIAKKHCKNLKNINFSKSDVRNFKFKKSPMIISYYSIQFIHPRDRQDLISKIYESLEWGGAFIWFEKVRGSDARFQDILVNRYNNFKLENGFNYEEIFNKSESLKGILEPFSTEGNFGLLKRAGFVDSMIVYKNICFEGILSIK